MSYKLCRKISSSIWTYILLAPMAILLVIVLLLATLSGRKGSWLFESSAEDPEEMTYWTSGQDVDSQSRVNLPGPSRERLILSSM
jgi:hypothetical protein